MTDAVFLCAGCLDPSRDLQALRAAIGRAVAPLPVVPAPCLGQCRSPQTLAFRGEGREVFVFSGVTEGDLDGLRAFAITWAQTPGGAIADARPFGSLRLRLAARVPPLP